MADDDGCAVVRHDSVPDYGTTGPSYSAPAKHIVGFASLHDLPPPGKSTPAPALRRISSMRRPPRPVQDFLAGLFAAEDTVQYVLGTLKPDEVGDLQLAQSERELHSWLPKLSPAQVRKLWRALLAVPATEKELCSPTADDSEIDDCLQLESFHRPVSGKAPASGGPPLDRSLYTDLWPDGHERFHFMIEKGFLFQPNLLWIDVSSELLENRPQAWATDFPAYFDALADVFNLHPATIKDCLEPGELPKTEFTEGVTLLVMRYCKECPMTLKPVDVSDISSKLVTIITTHPKHPDVDVVISVHKHRLRANGNATFSNYYETQAPEFVHSDPGLTKDHLVNMLLDDVLGTYEVAVLGLRQAVDEYEKNLTNWTGRDITSELYAGRRRLSVYKRLLQGTHESIRKYVAHVNRKFGHDPFAQDLRDTVKSLLFSTEDLYESTTELLNLHMSLVDHQSNHLLYVLTIFSVMFTPLNFISSYYGMNFEGMPELKWTHGYTYCICLMASTLTVTALSLLSYGFIGRGSRRYRGLKS